jgi:hypothetical protein
MKKFFLTGFITCIATLISYSNSQAQSSGGSAKAMSKSLLTDMNTSVSGIYPLKDLKAKALKHFTQSFKQATNVNWYSVKDGIMAYFIEDGIKTRACYTNKGAWLYNLRNYSGKFLPADERRQIKYTFIDYDITWVNEIKTPKEMIYMVHIEDSTRFKIVRLSGGDLEIAEEYSK